MSQAPVSEPKKTNTGCILIPFGIVFTIAGAVMLWSMVLLPTLNYYAAKSWQETLCTITRSEVEDRSDSEGSSYAPIVEFKYQVDGRNYEQQTFAFVGVSSGSSQWAHGISRKYPVGSEQACFYDPAKPAKAVLDRSFQVWIWSALFALMFMGAGLGCLIGSIFQGARATNARNRRQHQLLSSRLTQVAGTESLAGFGQAADQEDEKFEGPQRLKPESSRWAPLVVIAILALFWNGIVFGGFAPTIFANGFHWMILFKILFFLPFALIGFGLFVLVIYLFLRLFNPAVEVAMSSGAVPIGGTVDVAWEVRKGFRKIRAIRIFVEGSESATYQQGTSTHTDREVFEQLVACDSADPAVIEFGSCVVTIPVDTMHSFKADKNEIAWAVRVEGEIPWWPDVNETFEFRVKPE